MTPTPIHVYYQTWLNGFGIIVSTYLMENEEKLVEKMTFLSGKKEDYIRKDQLVSLLNQSAWRMAEMNKQENQGRMGTPHDVVRIAFIQLANDIQALNA